MSTLKQSVDLDKFFNKMSKEITDDKLSKIIELAKELANDLCPTTSSFFNEVTVTILLEASAKASSDTFDNLRSAIQRHTLIVKIFDSMLRERIENNFFSSPEQLIASLKEAGVWKK